MAPFAEPLRRRVPVFLTTPFVSFASAWRAAALAIPDVGVAAFFIAGIAAAGAGGLAPWFVLAAVLLSVACRTLDIEGWGLLVRGGMVGRAGLAFGPRVAAVAAAAQLLERVLFASLVSLVFGQYVAALPMRLHLSARISETVSSSGDLASVAAIGLLGFAWTRARLGYITDTNRAVSRTVGAVAALLVVVVGAVITVLAHRTSGLPPVPWFVGLHTLAGGSTGPIGILLAALFAFGHALPAVGSGDSLARAANQLEPPRIRGVRRTLVILLIYGGFVTVATTFLFVWLVPVDVQPAWSGVPLLGILDHLPGPAPLRALGTIGVVASGALLLGQAVRAGISGAERMLAQLGQQGRVPHALTMPHGSFGTLARAIDTGAGAAAAAIILSAGHVEWLAHAYAACLAWTLLLKVTVLIRLRQPHGEAPFRVPGNLRLGRTEWPVGMIAIGIAIAATWIAMVLRGDPPTISASLALAVVAAVFAATASRLPTQAPEETDPLEIISSRALTLEQIDARPGGVLVAVRNPNSLAHLSHAFAAAGDRDVVVMTARLIGIDAEDDPHDLRPTPGEQSLFSNVMTLAERHGRNVRLLIVPTSNVFDAAVAAVLRLKASDVFVGESSTLSSDAQARLLGDAWERSETGHLQGVRLVILHRSGRTENYHLGAHDPTLTSSDLDLIHQMWLDAVKVLGPHVHHHDLARAALKNMAEQLKGPGRDDALKVIQTVARPADELAGIVHTRDFTRLRDLIRNRPADHLASLLGDLSIEDQVVVFRLLPRKDAAATFEYLTLDQQEALLKAMAQEDVAALLNEMAPDDRTMFLEELPAPVTRQLLALLTPTERTIASTLLGYPEGSIGRLMTPAYIAVQEYWTIQQVLDFVREHGQDSETLNVIYVVDAHGTLVDDLRIRALLLADPSNRVSDLMDRRYVTLKATDDQATAVAQFRANDRTALPVTDTTGVLIGIVTVDDVLDILETQTTEDIQRIGGSEALDEPYMVISFGRMIRKRAGWLTALFLGEMLTATAMSAFEMEIERAVVLALFVPLIISSGGNSGSQASTLVIRALALGELSLRDWWRVARREIAAGLALGGILGSIGFLRITVWSAFSTLYGPHWLLVAITVSLALVGIVLWGTLVGSLLPFVLRRLGFDPATSSAPFVATLVDVTGLIIYFSVAILVLRGTLL
ncbi:MAG: magnesium transporter [Vicinamibacterales bacterium]